MKASCARFHRRRKVSLLLLSILALQVQTVLAQVFSNQQFVAGPRRVWVSAPHRYGLFRESDALIFETTGNTAVRVWNLRGQTIYEGKPKPLRLTAGHYFVECKDDRTQFAVLPNDYSGASFLGTEPDFGDDPQRTARIDFVAPAWTRIMGGGCYWSQAEPERGVWDWRAADRTVAVNAVRGRKLIMGAFLRPDWLNDDKDFLPHYVEYLRLLAHRYGKKLYAIEVWNEPWITAGLWGRLPNIDAPNRRMDDWKQLARIYSRLLAVARETIKSVAPNIKVIGPAWTNATTYYDVTEELTKNGGTALLDGFSFHDYDEGRYLPDLPTPYLDRYVKPVNQKIETFRKCFPDNPMPIYVDEIGLYGASALGIRNTGRSGTNSGIPWHRGMCRAIKLVLLYRAAGASALIPHIFLQGSGDPNDNLEIAGWELGDRGPHPKTSAFLMACYWLNNSQLEASRIIDDTIFLYQWRRPDGSSVLFVWSAENKTFNVLPVRGLKKTDVFGQKTLDDSLNEEPILYHAAPGTSTATMLDAVAASIQPQF